MRRLERHWKILRKSEGTDEERQEHSQEIPGLFRSRRSAPKPGSSTVAFVVPLVRVLRGSPHTSKHYVCASEGHPAGVAVLVSCVRIKLQQERGARST